MMIQTGALSYGVAEENPVFLDEAGTMMAGAFSFNSRFVGDPATPALITAALDVLDASGTIVVGTLFLQGIQNDDFSLDLAIVGGSGNFVGVTGQVRSPTVTGELIPIEVFFF